LRIRILGAPLQLIEQTLQHYEAVERELQLIGLSRDTPLSNPAARLLALAAAVRHEYGRSSFPPAGEIASAHDRGADVLDLEFEVRPSARAPTLQLLVAFDEADEWCRNGELLTLETPPDCRAMRTWYLSEVVRQLDGLPPTKWPGPLRDE